MLLRKKIAGLMVLGASTLLPQTGLTLSAATYKVYYADQQGWQAQNTRVHVWSRSEQGMDTPYKEWDANESMTVTDKYLSLDGRYIPVYSYEFDWDMQPFGVIFHTVTGTKSQTADYGFVEGGLYLFVEKGGDASTALVADPVIVDKSELPKTVVYFADTGNWGPDNTQIHIWGSAGDFTPFLSDPTMTDTGKYALVNDVWARVYQYTYLYDGVVEGVMFHLKGNNFSTADYKEMDGAMYAYAGNKKSAPVETAPVFLDAIPHDTPRPVSLYVNLGANQMMQTGLWDEPCAHVYRREDSATDYESLLPEYGSEAYQAEVIRTTPGRPTGMTDISMLPATVRAARCVCGSTSRLISTAPPSIRGDLATERTG